MIDRALVDNAFDKAHETVATEVDDKDDREHGKGVENGGKSRATMMKLKNETKVGNGMTKMHDSSAHLLGTPLI